MHFLAKERGFLGGFAFRKKIAALKQLSTKPS